MLVCNTMIWGFESLSRLQNFKGPFMDLYFLINKNKKWILVNMSSIINKINDYLKNKDTLVKLNTVNFHTFFLYIVNEEFPKIFANPGRYRKILR